MTQATWAAYYSPASETLKGDMLVVSPGIKTCDEAKKIVDEVGADEQKRAQVNQRSLRLVAESFNQLRYAEMGPKALELLDALRSAAAREQQSAQPSP